MAEPILKMSCLFPAPEVLTFFSFLQETQLLHRELHKTIGQQKAEIEEMAKAEKGKDQLIAELQKKLQQNDGTNTFFLRSAQLVSTQLCFC